VLGFYKMLGDGDYPGFFNWGKANALFLWENLL